MKVSLDLHAQSYEPNTRFMMETYNGVIDGWSNLPITTQQVVEWVGINFLIGDIKRIRVDIKVCKNLTITSIKGLQVE